VSGRLGQILQAVAQLDLNAAAAQTPASHVVAAGLAVPARHCRFAITATARRYHRTARGTVHVIRAL